MAEDARSGYGKLAQPTGGHVNAVQQAAEGFGTRPINQVWICLIPIGVHHRSPFLRRCMGAFFRGEIGEFMNWPNFARNPWKPAAQGGCRLPCSQKWRHDDQIGGGGEGLGQCFRLHQPALAQRDERGIIGAAADVGDAFSVADEVKGGQLQLLNNGIKHEKNHRIYSLFLLQFALTSFGCQKYFSRAYWVLGSDCDRNEWEKRKQRGGRQPSPLKRLPALKNPKTNLYRPSH